MVELKISPPPYKVDLPAQRSMSNFYCDVRVYQIIICYYHNPKIVLRIDYHDALKINVLSPLSQRITLLAALNAWS